MQPSGPTTMLSARYPNSLAAMIRDLAQSLGVSVSDLLIEGARMAVEQKKETGA